MARADLRWRLEGGYSRFLEGSQVELRLEEGPLRQTLDLFPAGLLDRSKPVKLTFRAAQGFWGVGPGKLRWRISPNGVVRSVILFSGNAFLGNFRVPQGHFAVQWDVDAKAEGGVGKKRARFLMQVEGGTRLHHSWVEIFPEELSIRHALKQAWQGYRDPFDPSDVFQISESQVVRWSWSGFVRIGIGVEWSLGVGWVIPGKLPLAKLQGQVMSRAGLGAHFQIEEKGRFELRVKKRRGKIDFRLRRRRERKKSHGFSARVALRNPVRIDRLGVEKSKALRIVSDALAGPVVKRTNQVLRDALVRRLEIALAVEKTRWKRRSTILHALWSQPDERGFKTAYAQLLEGKIPGSSSRLRVSGTFEEVRGQRLVINFNVLNWIQFKKSKERRIQQTVTVSPEGEVLLETAEVLEKSVYHWDEVQFLRLVRRETGSGLTKQHDFTWTYGREGTFSRDELHQLLRMALHYQIISHFRLPARSLFPLKVRVLLVTKFLRQGLVKVRRASPKSRWQALVRALEIAEPKRYAANTFWRDWIDSHELREKVDRDPVQAQLVTHYPVGGRNRFERIQVVTAYRKAKRFLALLEQWSHGQQGEVFQVFPFGMDVPIYVFFHLLCPSRLRRSAVMLTGELEEVWGEAGLLTTATAGG